MPPLERPRARADLVAKEIEGDVVVYDPLADQVVLLNLTGAAVLELCDGTRTPAEIAAEISGITAAPPQVALSDVLRLLGELHEAGLLRNRRS